MSTFNAYMFNNLTELAVLGRDTHLCIDEHTKKLYTVKHIPREYTGCFRAIEKINSPYLSKILYIDEISLSIVCEYVSGDTVADILAEYGSFEEKTAIKAVSEVCAGLSALHKAGIVHRDINPNNIVITSGGTAKIIDYGIIRSFTNSKSRDTEILGTPGYAAPEQFGFTQSDMKTDIYSAGVLLNVMLTGYLPNEKLFRGKAGKIISKCTEIDASKRYKSIDDLKKDLDTGIFNSVKSGPAEKFISAVPGLRSPDIKVAAVSAVAYVIAFIIIFLLIIRPSELGSNAFSRFIEILFLIIIPFISLSDFMNIWERLFFTVTAEKKTKKKIAWTVAVVSFFAAYLFTFADKYLSAILSHII